MPDSDMFYCTYLQKNKTENGCYECRQTGNKVRKEFFGGCKAQYTHEECIRRHKRHAIGGLK